MIRRLSVYETKARFYLVGSDGPGKSHSVLKIVLIRVKDGHIPKVDRTERGELNVSTGSHRYDDEELNQLLSTIYGGSFEARPNAKGQPPSAISSSTLIERHRNAFGLLGFVRFTAGWYMVVVTRASKVAQLGYHGLYKVEDVALIDIDVQERGGQSAEEAKYVKAFQSVDLSTHFYFAYSYDLSHTLQENLSRPPGAFVDAEDKFVWNRHLMLSGLRRGVGRKWFVGLVHGYVGQTSLHLPAVRLGLVLIARRSNRYAGTRFLKRGASLMGHVGNEVETEQILFSESGPESPSNGGRYTSFVQHRGSVPLVWSQDPALRPPVVTGKPPPISLDLREPWAEIPALHFRDLRQKYGSPLLAINLCKRRERRAHESLLNDEYRQAIAYLNQFLPPDERLLYLSFDMARCNKAGSVLPKLEEIAYRCVRRTRWFQSFPPSPRLSESPLAQGLPDNQARGGQWRVQSGVARTNCVDCLDRTNVAQFVMGKVALAYQLYAMDLLAEPVLPMDAEICRVLETLYEEHGDTMALQYAGSHLVHSLKTYQKTKALQERSRDVIQTLSRYYSNTFADYDKQSAINLFLGLYRPREMRGMSLWELSTDLRLHSPGLRPKVDYCEWYRPDPSRRRPVFAVCQEKERVAVEELDDFALYYRTYELSSLDAVISRRLGEWKRVKLDGAKAESASGQPFLRLWKRQTDSAPPPEAAKKEAKAKGRAAAKEEDDASLVSSEEELDAVADASSGLGGGNSSDTEIRYADGWTSADDLAGGKRSATPPLRPFTFRRHFRNEREVYGIVLRRPSASDMAKYEAYAALSGGCGAAIEGQAVLPADRDRALEVKPMSLFTNDSTFSTALPIVSKSAEAKYAASVAAGDLDQGGPQLPSPVDLAAYLSYVDEQRRLVTGLV